MRLSPNTITFAGPRTFPPVVWLASYPRSGNTLLRTILWHCFGLRSASVYRDEIADSGTIANFIGHIDPNADGLIHLPTNDIPLLKTHEPPIDEHPAIYIVRYGPAACVSLWRFYNGAIPLEAIIEGRHGFGTWSNHLKSWRSWERPNTLLLKYEEMTDNLEGVLKKLGHFLQRDIKADRIPDRDIIADANTPLVQRKRDWRLDISSELLERFNTLNREMLETMGYHE